MAGRDVADDALVTAVPAGRGRHRAPRRSTGLHAWLGTGVVALGVGAALTAGAGVAQADTGSGPRVSPSGPGPQTTIRTIVRATTITSESASTPFVSTKDSVVTKPGPADIGDNDDDSPTGLPSLSSQLVVMENGVPGLENVPSVPFLELGGGGLLSKIAGVLSGGIL